MDKRTASLSISGAPSAAFTDTKPHYHILDGLRGVAALTVVCYHIFEAYATSHVDQHVNHGYLGVDFFFILSGFVIGYAYDDRWSRLTIATFIKRRIIRLHPMVVMGTLIGTALFYLQGCEVWDVSKVSPTMLVLAAVAGMCLFPATPGWEVRGVGEMFPLNGPSWSLFYEYIGNILYAFILRRLSTRALAVWILMAGCGLAAFAIGGELGDLGAGFTLRGYDLLGGSLRLLFAFAAGLLMARVFRPVKIKAAFWLCSISVVVLLAFPRIGGYENLLLNGIYDTLCAVLLLPVIVYLGASGQTTDPLTTRICKFMGDVSYPLYIVHYPFIYWYYAWVKNENLTFAASLPGAIALIVGCILLAWLCLKAYDEPVRRWLTYCWLRTAAK